MWEIVETVSGGCWLLPTSLPPSKNAKQFKVGGNKFYGYIWPVVDEFRPYIEALCKQEPRVIADKKLHVWIWKDGTYQVTDRATKGRLGVPTKEPSATSEPQVPAPVHTR